MRHIGWLWRRLSDIQTVFWIIGGGVAATPVVFAVIEGVPLSLISLYLINAVAFVLVFVGEGLPVWRDFQQRRRERRDWVAIDAADLVIAAYFNSAFGLLPEASLPSGIYVIARDVRLTNKSTSAVVLSISLQLRTPERERSLTITTAPAPMNTLLQSPPAGMIPMLMEQRLPNPANLDAANGTAGYAVFRMPWPGEPGVAKRIEEIQSGELRWRVTDSLSGQVADLAVRRTRQPWLVL
jgi:hypothetical protein